MPLPIQAGGQQPLALRALELCGSQGMEFNERPFSPGAG